MPRGKYLARHYFEALYQPARHFLEALFRGTFRKQGKVPRKTSNLPRHFTLFCGKCLANWPRGTLARHFSILMKNRVKCLATQIFWNFWNFWKKRNVSDWHRISSWCQSISNCIDFSGNFCISCAFLMCFLVFGVFYWFLPTSLCIMPAFRFWWKTGLSASRTQFFLTKRNVSGWPCGASQFQIALIFQATFAFLMLCRFLWILLIFSNFIVNYACNTLQDRTVQHSTIKCVYWNTHTPHSVILQHIGAVDVDVPRCLISDTSSVWRPQTTICRWMDGWMWMMWMMWMMDGWMMDDGCGWWMDGWMDGCAWTTMSMTRRPWPSQTMCTANTRTVRTV